MASSLSSVIVHLHPSILPPSRLLLSELTTHGQSIPLADLHEAWPSFIDLATLAQPVALITVKEMWRLVEGTDNRDSKRRQGATVEKCIKDVEFGLV